MLNKFLHPSALVLWLPVIVLMLLGLEAITYEGFVTRQLGFAPTAFWWVSLLPLVIYRYIGRRTAPERLQRGLLYAVPVVVALATMVQILHPVVHTNFFFSTFHIHPPLLEPIALFLSLATLICFDTNFLRRNQAWSLFVAPFWALCLSVYFKWNFPRIFWYIEKEDSLTEYLTFLVYIAVGVIALRCLPCIRQKNKLTTRWRSFYLGVFILIAVVAFVIAGEEISWGQRLIGFETPASIAANNTQYEFNIHNQRGVFRHVYDAYALTGLYGAFSWVAVIGLRGLCVFHS